MSCARAGSCYGELRPRRVLLGELRPRRAEEQGLAGRGGAGRLPGRVPEAGQSDVSLTADLTYPPPPLTPALPCLSPSSDSPLSRLGFPRLARLSPPSGINQEIGLCTRVSFGRGRRACSRTLPSPLGSRVPPTPADMPTGTAPPAAPTVPGGRDVARRPTRHTHSAQGQPGARPGFHRPHGSGFCVCKQPRGWKLISPRSGDGINLAAPSFGT